MAGELVEDQRQGERQLFVLEARRGVQDRLPAEVCGGLLDDGAAAGAPSTRLTSGSIPQRT